MLGLQEMRELWLLQCCQRGFNICPKMKREKDSIARAGKRKLANYFIGLLKREIHLSLIHI